MSQETTETANTYTRVERMGRTDYDCTLCGHTAVDLDAARAHRALHVAGPELLEALRAWHKNRPCPQPSCNACDAIKKAEPTKGAQSQ